MTLTGHRRTAPRRAVSGAARPVIERASATDRAFLAMDTGQVPEQFGIVLLLDPVGGFDLARARRVVARRITAVPRLRKRLVHVPFGCGAPIWADDPEWDAEFTSGTFSDTSAFGRIETHSLSVMFDFTF